MGRLPQFLLLLIVGIYLDGISVDESHSVVQIVRACSFDGTTVNDSKGIVVSINVDGIVALQSLR